MSLDVHVIPGVITTLKTLVPSPQGSGSTDTTVSLLRGVSWGPRFSVPETPWAWVQNSTFTVPPLEGSALDTVDWIILVRLIHKYAPDQSDAEVRLSALIEPIRAAFRAHIKMGQPTIARALVSGGSWGYMEINNIWYRYCDLDISVREKESHSYAA